MTSESIKHCLLCQDPIRGRTDKKFCNDFCRNQYHNQLRTSSDMLIRKINQVLLKNRKILQSMLPSGEEMIRVTKDQLMQEGFLFRYHTHEYQNAGGATYCFCYDFGYLLLDNNSCLVVHSVQQS